MIDINNLLNLCFVPLFAKLNTKQIISIVFVLVAVGVFSGQNHINNQVVKTLSENAEVETLIFRKMIISTAILEALFIYSFMAGILFFFRGLS